MLGWAARARANPKFDVEERDHRLEIARLAADVLAAAAREEPIGEPTESLYGFVRPRLPEVVVPRHLAHLRKWATDDEQGLAHALRAFSEPALAPAERLERFVESSLEREPGDRGLLYATALGSLFNFATAPGELPIVRPPVFGAIQRTLGETEAAGSAGDRYRHDVAFTRRMHEGFAQAGIPVRDLIDTDALLLICWEDHQFWAADNDGRRPRRRAPDHYLAACAIYRDEADFLAEWIEFHRLVGFERFYLYNNFSSDDHLDVLEPYVVDGLVVLHDWPQVPGQFGAYDHCIQTHGEESRWIGFFDIDEFVFSPTYGPVGEILTSYESAPGVCVNLPRFGTSGHRKKPSGLVIENYVVRLQTLAERTVKSIVDPAAVDRCLNAHVFAYHRRSAVSTNGFPVHGTVSKSATLDLLRANHYYTKSEEELRAKHTRRTADYGWERRQLPDSATLAEAEAERGVPDDLILHYAQPLHEALARRTGVG